MPPPTRIRSARLRPVTPARAESAGKPAATGLARMEYLREGSPASTRRPNVTDQGSRTATTIHKPRPLILASQHNVQCTLQAGLVNWVSPVSAGR